MKERVPAVGAESEPRHRSDRDGYDAALVNAARPPTKFVPLSVPRPVSSQRLEGEAFADRAEGVAFDDAGRRHRPGDRLADMGEPHRTAGQEHGVDVGCGQSRLREADLDAGRDALGQLPCMADKIGTADGGV